MPRLRPIAGGLATVAAIGGMIIAAPAAHAIGAPAGCSSQSVSTPVRTNDARVVPLSFMCSINGGSVASVTIVTPPAHGTLTGPPETPLYTPAPGYTGPDQVTFRIVNAAGSSGDLSWPFQVFDGAGYAPQCFGVHPTYVHNDAAAEIRLNCFDEDLKQVTFSIASPPQHGTLSAITPDDFTPMAASLTPTEVTSEASVRYTADPGYTGSDSFTITGDDGHHTSPPATVNLTVGATANHAPICTPFGTAILAAGWPMQVLAACMDPDGDPVTITTTQDPAHGALGAWAVKWYGPSAATYTPDSGFTGADSVAIQATDAHGATSATATIPLTVQDTAPTPTINCAARLLSVTRNVTLTTPPMPCFTLTGAEAALTIGSPPSHGTATITPAGELSYAPDRNYIGPDVLTLHAVAGSATLDSQVVISVISNAKATILSGPPASSTDTFQEFSLYGEAGTTLTCALSDSPQSTPTPCSGTKSYTGTPAGDHVLTVTATDGQGRISRDTYAFHVAATALPPSGGSGGGGGGGGTTPAPPANATGPAPAPAPADAPAPSSSPSEDTHTTDASQALRGPLGALLRTKLPVAALLRKGHAVVRFSAPGPGKITVRWMVGDPHALDGRVILAAATGRATRAGTVRLTVHITSAGRRILGRAQRPIQVLAGATFSGAGAAMTTLFAPVSVSRS